MTDLLMVVYQWKRKVSIKSLNSKDTRHIFSGTAFYEHDSSKQKFQTFGKPRKNISGPDVGPRSASEELGRMLGSKRRDPESSTHTDRQNQRLRHET